MSGKYNGYCASGYIHNNLIVLSHACSVTRHLIDRYEQQCQKYMVSTTLSQFNLLFPVSATSSKLLAEKETVTLKFKSYRGEDTIEDLIKLVGLFGVSGNHFHLFKIEDSCSTVIWLCSTTELKQLTMAILDANDSLQSSGVMQVLVGEESVLEFFQPRRSAAGKYYFT